MRVGGTGGGYSVTTLWVKACSERSLHHVQIIPAMLGDSPERCREQSPSPEFPALSTTHTQLYPDCMWPGQGVEHMERDSWRMAPSMPL